MALARDIIENAFDSLLSRKLRTALSVMGIIIGVFAVIMIGSISVSGKKIIFDELTTFGLKSIWIWVHHDEYMGKGPKVGNGLETVDVEDIKRSCPSVQHITPVISKRGILARVGTRQMRIKLYCVNEDYTSINNDFITMGRRLMPNDIRFKTHVCLIGDEVVKQLFNNQNPLGQAIKLENNWFTVAGVLKRKNRSIINSLGGSGKYTVNGRIIIPISVFEQYYNTSGVDYLQAEAVFFSKSRLAAQEIVNVLRQRHRNRFNYKSETMQEYIEITEKIIKVISWVGSMAALISLIVGGIGIMNIMTAVVVERTREIGIRKALGATKGDILWQFLMESVTIGLFGGLLGTVASMGVIVLLEFQSGYPLFLSYGYIFLALIVSLAVGLVSGIYPAMRAAAMDPVDALRTE